MLHKIDTNKKGAFKLIFFNEFFLERYKGFLMLKIHIENQILALFDVYFWPFNKSQEKFNTIFVISAIIASIWNVFIKFRWHDEKLTYAGFTYNGGPENRTILNTDINFI